MATRKAGPQPALMLMYSTAANNAWPLNREATIIGRARNCDIALDAPDISTLHCIITRSAGGYSVRDCSSRAGVRINGDNVAEGTLHDGDVLQIGPFSFRVVLPVREHSSGARETRIRHLDRARQNLVRLALSLRRRLRQAAPAASVPDVAKQLDYQRDLSQKASGLRLRVKDYERRLAELELAEREVSQDRELLNRELDAVRAQAQRADQDITRRREEVESHLRARTLDLKQLEEQLRSEEKQLAQQRERFAIESRKQDHEYLQREIEDLRARALRTDQELARRRLEFETESLARQHELEEFEARLRSEEAQIKQERTEFEAQLRSEEAQLKRERAEFEAQLRREQAQLRLEREQLTAERRQLADQAEEVNAHEHRHEEQLEHWEQQRLELEKLAAHLEHALASIQEFHQGAPARLPENATFA